MADKILSLASVKKCLEKVKSWASEKFNALETKQSVTESMAGATQKRVNDMDTELSSCIKTYPQKNRNFDEELDPGIYRIGDNNTNGPKINVSYSNLFNIKDYQNDTIQQLVFPYLGSINTFAARWGGINATGNNFVGGHPWLYFHGSTSPNIPVLKKKIIKGMTNDNADIGLNLYVTNAIVLAVYVTDCDDKSGHISVTIYNNYVNTASIGVHVESYSTNEQLTNNNITLTVYYLEIPSDYEIPDTVQVSDEPEDDIGILQANEAEQEFPHAEE